MRAVPGWRDVWLALGVMVLMIVGSDVALPDDPLSQLPGLAGLLPLDAVDFLLILAGSLPLAFRRIAPLPVFLVCAVAALTEQLHERPPPLNIGVIVALFSLAMLRRPVVAAAAAIGYLAALGVLGLNGLGSITDDIFYTYLLVVAATVLLGYGVALGRARTRLAEQRARALAREQETRTQAAVEQEQARIAREIHDIVAHHLSVIVAQAAAAGRVVGAQPQTVAAALSAIETSGRDALHGLRGLVWMLRTGPGDADHEPQPGLDRLPWLLAQVRQAGLPVSLSVRGNAKPLSATVELNAYRIIQEALTNVLKHAGPAEAFVSLDYGGECLAIEVSDTEEAASWSGVPGQPAAVVSESVSWRGPGTGSPPSGSGYGLISMKQRAALLGGELVAERVDGCGFRVAARLPLTGSQP